MKKQTEQTVNKKIIMQNNSNIAVGIVTFIICGIACAILYNKAQGNPNELHNIPQIIGCLFTAPFVIILIGVWHKYIGNNARNFGKIICGKVEQVEEARYGRAYIHIIYVRTDDGKLYKSFGGNYKQWYSVGDTVNLYIWKDYAYTK